jgi:hypothetical protein
MNLRTLVINQPTPHQRRLLQVIQVQVIQVQVISGQVIQVQVIQVRSGQHLHQRHSIWTQRTPQIISQVIIYPVIDNHQGI